MGFETKGTVRVYKEDHFEAVPMGFETASSMTVWVTVSAYFEAVPMGFETRLQTS